MTREFLAHSEAETVEAGREISKLLPADAIVHLAGDLGAGKTFLVRSIATALGADPRDVASPSFAIVHQYPLPDGSSIVHIDGYRLSDSPREWLEIGIDDMLREPGLKFIEWPKGDFSRFGSSNVRIDIRVVEDEARMIRIDL